MFDIRFAVKTMMKVEEKGYATEDDILNLAECVREGACHRDAFWEVFDKYYTGKGNGIYNKKRINEAFDEAVK